MFYCTNQKVKYLC